MPFLQIQNTHLQSYQWRIYLWKVLPLKPWNPVSFFQLSRPSITSVRHGNFSTCTSHTDEAATLATKKASVEKPKEKGRRNVSAWVLPCSEALFRRHWSTYAARLHATAGKQQRCCTSESGEIAGCSNVSLSTIWFFFLSAPPKPLRGALTGEDDEEVEEVKGRGMEERKEGGEGGEGRLRREQSAGLVCCRLPEAALGSAFAPLLQQCEAAARAACCYHRFTAKQGHGLLRMLDSGFCSSAA